MKAFLFVGLLSLCSYNAVTVVYYIYITFKSFSRRSYPERLTNWCIHITIVYYTGIRTSPTK
jgi:hypothetical protein